MDRLRREIWIDGITNDADDIADVVRVNHLACRRPLGGSPSSSSSSFTSSCKEIKLAGDGTAAATERE
jgi:hypothetical protein